MQAIPEIVPWADMQARLADIESHLPRGPVVLTRDDRATAVLVSLEVWNDLIAELEELRDTMGALLACDTYQQEPEAVRSWSEIRANLVAEGHLDSE
jgi:PHD/YefM family antitoxin component YafN of YafNO toxin-antitoxin module